jgi:hypothetical protein
MARKAKKTAGKGKAEAPKAEAKGAPEAALKTGPRAAVATGPGTEAKTASKPESKAAVKTTINAKPKAQTEKYLAKVPEAYVFWCHDGQIFRDIEDLINGFDLMSDDIFFFHANDEKNDFSCWIADIIGDSDLAEEVKQTKTRHQAKKATQQRYYDLTTLEG